MRALEMARDCAGFFGFAKTCAAIRPQAQVFWLHMRDGVCDYVRAREVYRKRGGYEMEARQPLRPPPYPRRILFLAGVDEKQMPEAEGGEKYLIAAAD